MRAFRSQTLTQLHDQLCYTIVEAPREKLDVVTTVDVQIHNVIAEAQSMEWQFDMKNMWLTKSRWSMMARQYIDPDEFTAWIEQCAGKIGTKGRGIAVMRTKVVKPRGGPAQGNKETRRWGSCMLAISYKAKPRPQITLYSRTSYLGYLAALDLSVAWMAARYLAQAMGIRVEDIAFVWMNEATQYHNFKSLAYLLNHPDEELRHDYRTMILENKMKRAQKERLDSSPALQLSRRWMSRLQKADEEGQTLGDMSYNTYRRIRRRYHTEVMGYEYAQQFEGWSYYKKGPKEGEQKEFYKAYAPLPSVPIETLDFSPIGLSLTGVKPVDYDEASEDLDEEDDE